MTQEEKRLRRQERRLKIRELQELAKGPIDMPFLVLVLMLTVIGLIMLFSASFPSALNKYNDAAYFVIRQARFAAAGVAFMLVMSKINYQRLRGVATFVLLASIVLLILVVLPGPNEYGKLFGVRENNAVRWLRMFLVAGPTYQPSEVAKLGIIIYFAATISQRKDKMRTFKYGILPYGILLGIYALLMLAEPHLSGCILLVGIGAVMMVVGGMDWRWVTAGILLACLALYAVLFTDLMEIIGYNSSRILTWRDPFWDPKDDSYQMAQSLIAIGSGGLFGVGLGRGRQKFMFLPEEHNDFIFAIICEELGYVGAGIIMILFALLIIRGYWIAIHARDRFGALLAVGVTTQIGLQVFLNIAVVTGLIPATGISLPFFSYGGTALLIQLFEVGIVLSVSRQMPAMKAG